MRGKVNSFKFFLPAQEALMLIHDLPLFLLLFSVFFFFFFGINLMGHQVRSVEPTIQYKTSNQPCSIKSILKTTPNKRRLNLVFSLARDDICLFTLLLIY